MAGFQIRGDQANGRVLRGTTTGDTLVWDNTAKEWNTGPPVGPPAFSPGVVQVNSLNVAFGSPSITEATSIFMSVFPPIVRLGFAPGTPGGVGIAAASGALRMARTGDATVDVLMAARNLSDTADQQIITLDSNASAINFGGSGASFNSVRVGNGVDLRCVASNSITLEIAGQIKMVAASSRMEMRTANLGWLTGLAGVVSNNDDVNPGVCNMTFRGGNQTLTTGNNTGCAATLAGGSATGVGASNNAGGKVNVTGGDASGATVTNIGSDALLRAGRGTGTGAADGNISIHADASSFQSMQRGIFVGDRAAAPTGNPVGGGFFYSEAGALKWRGSAGTTTVVAPA